MKENRGRQGKVKNVSQAAAHRRTAAQGGMVSQGGTALQGRRRDSETN